MLYFETHIINKEAEWLVFIHGAGGGIPTWKYQTKTFKPYFNLLLMDLRDHGQSKNMSPDYKDYNFEIIGNDILEVVDHLEIEKANFMSLSMGSVILQKLEELRPNLIDRMVMAGGVFRANLKMKIFAHGAKFLNYFLSYRTMYDLFSLIVLPRKNHRVSRRIFRLQSMKLTPKEYMKWVGLYRDFFKVLRRFFNQKIEKLSLVVMGDQDHVFIDAARRFVKKQELAQLVILEKCGHVVNIEQAKKFNQIALDFLLGRK